MKTYYVRTPDGSLRKIQAENDASAILQARELGGGLVELRKEHPYIKARDIRAYLRKRKPKDE